MRTLTLDGLSCLQLLPILIVSGQRLALRSNFAGPHLVEVDEFFLKDVTLSGASDTGDAVKSLNEGMC